MGIMSLAQEVLNTSHIRLMLIMFEENTSGFCSYFQGNLDLYPSQMLPESVYIHQGIHIYYIIHRILKIGAIFIFLIL